MDYLSHVVASQHSNLASNIECRLCCVCFGVMHAAGWSLDDQQAAVLKQAYLEVRLLILSILFESAAAQATLVLYMITCERFSRSRGVWMALQKLEGLVAVLAPKEKPQKDVSILENILVSLCVRSLKAKSAFGKLIRGPQSAEQSDAAWEFSVDPAVWEEKQLTGHELVLPDNRSLAVSCKRVRQHTSQSIQ